jgi:2',3'-cyclic-nucleotide 2'-phosphodiesterase (5'-nucleotidase family)
MTAIIRRLVAAALAAGLCAGMALAETVDVTFLLVNDIYKMSGKDRGGFARLAGVVKGERAKGGNVLYVHAGDTISPSLMSGFDQGAHIIDLTNSAPPDIFAPGNHEFDFGADVFMKRMGEAKFPILAANLRDADGNPIAGIEDT